MGNQPKKACRSSQTGLLAGCEGAHALCLWWSLQPLDPKVPNLTRTALSFFGLPSHVVHSSCLHPHLPGQQQAAIFSMPPHVPPPPELPGGYMTTT